MSCLLETEEDIEERVKNVVNNLGQVQEMIEECFKNHERSKFGLTVFTAFVSGF